MPLKNYCRQITISEKFRDLPSTMREFIIFVTVRERCHRLLIKFAVEFANRCYRMVCFSSPGSVASRRSISSRELQTAEASWDERFRLGSAVEFPFLPNTAELISLFVDLQVNYIVHPSGYRFPHCQRFWPVNVPFN